MRGCDGVLWRNKEKIRRGRQHRQKSPEKESGGDAVEFPREKAQMEKELRSEENEILKKGTGTRGCKAKYNAKHDAEHDATTTTTAAASIHHDGSCGETVTRKEVSGAL